MGTHPMKLYYEDQAGEITSGTKEEFLANFIKVNNVEPFTDDESITPPEEIAEGFFAMASKKQPLPEGLDELSAVYDAMGEALALSTKLESDAKAEAKRLKEEADQAKQAAAEAAAQAKQAVVLRQSSFSEAVSRAAGKASASLRDDLADVKEALPTGISVVFGDGDSFGLNIDSSVSDEELGGSLGYFMSKDHNTEFMKSAYQFFIGELANEMMRRKIYPSMIKCAKALSQKIKEQFGIRLHPRGLENYARMADRIPMELRNPRADSSAYLAISEIPYPGKKPLASNFETKEDFKAATEQYAKDCATVDEARLGLAAMLKNGKVDIERDGQTISLEMLSRKDILPCIDEAKKELGLKPKDDPDRKTAAAWLRQFFEATELLGLFGGVHKPNTVVVHPADGDGTMDLTAADLNSYLEQARSNLTEIFYGESLGDLKAGERTRLRQVYEQKDGKQVAVKDDEGKAVKSEHVEKFYPRISWL